MNGPTYSFMLALADKLRTAKHGGLGAIKKDACLATGVSLGELHARLKEVGYGTGRKARSDKGNTRVSDELLMNVAGLVNIATRQNSKQTLTIGQALLIANANGLAADGAVSASRVGQLLRERGLSADALAAPTPHRQLRYLHPNHCWQLDFSICVLYYLQNGAMGVMRATEFNKNKPANFSKIANSRLIRGVITDAFSGAILVHYHLGSETAQDLIDLFCWAVMKRDLGVVHGVPFYLMMDPGAANTSQLASNLFARLGVEVIVNMPGAPRAKGSVENAQNLVETQFEGLLRFQPTITSLEQINGLAQRWSHAYNAGKVHTRHGMTRYNKWLQITEAQLRLAPDAQLMRDLVMDTPQTREVDGELFVSFARRGHKPRIYSVADVPGVFVGAKVKVVVNAYRYPALDVLALALAPNTDGELLWHTVEPMAFDSDGYRVDAAIATQEYKAVAATATDKARDAIQKLAYAAETQEQVAAAKKAKKQAFAHLDTFKHIDEVPQPIYLPKRGLALDAPGTQSAPALAVPKLDVVDACVRLKAQLDTAYGPHVYAWLAQRYPDGVDAQEITALAAQFLQPAVQPAASAGAGGTGLRLIGGGREA